MVTIAETKLVTYVLVKSQPGRQQIHCDLWIPRMWEVMIRQPRYWEVRVRKCDCFQLGHFQWRFLMASKTWWVWSLDWEESDLLHLGKFLPEQFWERREVTARPENWEIRHKSCMPRQWWYRELPGMSWVCALNLLQGKCDTGQGIQSNMFHKGTEFWCFWEYCLCVVVGQKLGGVTASEYVNFL